MQIYAASYLLPMTGPPVAGGAIAVADGRIVAVGSLEEVRSAHAAPLREFPGSVIMPGLVNAHTHLELTHFPSWKLRKGIDYSPRTYVDWVIQVIKIRRALTRDERVNSVREGIHKSLECGTTAIGEILTDRSLLPLYHGSPLSGRLYFEAIGHDPVVCGTLLDGLEKDLASFSPGRLRPGLSPHAPHTLSASFMKDVQALACRHAIPTATHLAEAREELAFAHDSTGAIAELLYPFTGWSGYIPPPRRMTPVTCLDSVGLLTPGTAAVHCVQVTPADVEIPRKRDCAVILCPRSNDRLAVGRAPVHLLKKAGIPLALGTDSLASNDSLSLWDEMRFFSDQFPGEFTPADILAMATIGAARAISIQHETGSLEPGKSADFLVVGTAHPGAGDELYEAVIREGQVEELFVGGCQYLYP
jgi:cytosine/adenosine deaminase-related metal-dependent hydrolase